MRLLRLRLPPQLQNNPQMWFRLQLLQLYNRLGHEGLSPQVGEGQPLHVARDYVLLLSPLFSSISELLIDGHAFADADPDAAPYLWGASCDAETKCKRFHKCGTATQNIPPGIHSHFDGDGAEAEIRAWMARTSSTLAVWTPPCRMRSSAHARIA